MEHSEIDFVAAVSTAEEPRSGSEDHSPPSDLNHTVKVDDDALAVELHEKLDLKVEDEEGGAESEAEVKVSEFKDGGESVKDENEESVEDVVSVKGEERVDGDSKGWDTNSWNENVNEELGGGRDGAGYGDDGYGGGYGYGDGGEKKEDDYGGGYGDGYDAVYGYGDGVEKKEGNNSDGNHQFPLRPEAEDCSFYMKTGSCKFGTNCKFNHPIRRKNQAGREKVRDREEPAENSGQTECKYYQRSGGCKFGKACKFNHTRGYAAPISELNFLGLPIRLGEKECPYYMRTGSCKFGSNCRFNHPDPTTVGGSDPQSGYGNGGSVPLRGVSQQSASSWSSSSRKLNEAPYVPMMIPPTQGLAPQSPDWNGYQAPVYLSERIMHPSSTYVMNNPTIETNVYVPPQKQMPFEVYPERPGEPECSFFLKTGDCKFKSNCKFHHPKNRMARLPPCNLSDKGLPLRPDQSVCSHYSRYGICKFGPACRFDHPESALPLMMPGLGQQSYVNPANAQMAGMGGSAGDVTIQQSV
ncbi:zinc finger CCCH domain-containing protein 67-like [Vicia villosa]|uniref:zinc finger CCCH domain-containing protein 67-like n=1 Tax=Vicia villosa TaxID=3911 RepID=UPI00273CA054|nr:zinc finger CCCH domain-containing protein 67-like [Vicia villosa]